MNRRVAETAAEGGLGDLAAAALDDPQGTLATLERSATDLAEAPVRKAALDDAIRSCDVWSGELRAKRDDLDDLPAAHRIAEDEAAIALSAAEAALGAASRDREAAQAALQTMRAQFAALGQAREKFDEAKRRHKLLTTLVKLLGPKGLQGALVSEAQLQITAQANAFLRKLTGGSLELRLERDGSDEMRLLARDHTCMREPHDVRALSGSQKFRCAVAIAVGIGQYAGAGGMRAIVIDEGFASLDENNADQMIAELQSLAQHMERVIVVSHLPAFKDPVRFPDRLVVEAAGEGSRIRAAHGA